MNASPVSQRLAAFPNTGDITKENLVDTATIFVEDGEYVVTIHGEIIAREARAVDAEWIASNASERRPVFWGDLRDETRGMVELIGASGRKRHIQGQE